MGKNYVFCTLGYSWGRITCFHCTYTVKKLEVDLTKENVISVALWIYLDPGSGPPHVAMV